jgi:hypothetical protein
MSNTDDLKTKGGENDAAAVKSQLDEFKSQLDEALAAVKGAPKATEIKSLVEKIEAIEKSVGDLPGTYDAQLKAIGEQVDALQTGAALIAGKSADAPTGIKSITKAVEESGGFKGLFDAQGEHVQVCAPGTFGAKHQIPSYASVGYKAASPVTIPDVSGQNLEVYRPGIFQEPRWQMNLATRFPRIVVRGATQYTIPYETDASEYGAWTSTLAAALDGDPTPKSTIEFTDVDGLVVGSSVRFYDGDGVLLGSSVVVSINTSTKVVTFTTDSLTWDADIGDRVTSENYGATAELATKPSGWVGTDNRTWNFKTMASIIPTTVNALRTIAGLQQMIEGKLPERDLRNMSWHLLYGDATVANQIQGLRTYTGAQTYSWSAGPSGDNQVDAVMRAANLIPWTSDIGVIMSQADLPSLFLLKGEDGHYLRTGNFGMVPMTQIGFQWFLGPYELVFDYAVTSTHFTVVNWADTSELVDQDTAGLLWGYINDDFEKNIIRARYEATRLHAIKSTRSYVVGTWNSAPS